MAGPPPGERGGPLVRGLYGLFVPAGEDPQGTEYDPKEVLGQVFAHDQILLTHITVVDPANRVLRFASPKQPVAELDEVGTVRVTGKNEATVTLATRNEHIRRYLGKLPAFSALSTLRAAKQAFRHLLSIKSEPLDTSQIRIPSIGNGDTLPLILPGSNTHIQVLVRGRQEGQCLADVTLVQNGVSSTLRDVLAQTVPNPSTSDKTFPMQEDQLAEAMLQYGVFSMSKLAGHPIFPHNVTIQGATFNRRPAPRNELSVFATTTDLGKTTFSGTFDVYRGNVKMGFAALSCQGFGEFSTRRLLLPRQQLSTQR
jgi:hypothetical protein